MTKGRSQKPLPIIHAFLICDRIIQEERTHKKSLIGIFDTFHARYLPIGIFELSVYLNLSDVVRECSSKLELIDLQTNQVLFFEERRIPRAENPNWEIGFVIRGLQLPQIGDYAFRFWIGQDVIGEKYLRVVEAQR